MKKIVYYLFISIIFSLMFTLVDVLNRRVVINNKTGVVSDLINGGLGLGSTGLGSIGFGDFNVKQNMDANSVCTDDKPLLLTNGECVACDYMLDENTDVLIGCEKCSGNAKCLLKMDGEEKNKIQPRINKPRIESKHKYKLIKITGSDENLRGEVLETQSGRKKFVFIGGLVDGAVVKSVSGDGKIVVEKDGESQSLDIEM